MTCLAALNYDPGTAATKACTGSLAMTALDTANLRATFTVPSSGRVLVRLAGMVTGGTAMPSILLGVLEGATVRGRLAPMTGAAGTLAAATFTAVESVFLVTGLTPGANLTWDAAYGVETGQSGANIRYGGPNDTTTNNAFGAFSFSIWDA